MGKPVAAMSPLELTKVVRDISVTERGKFRTCRRQWELETLENLVPRKPPSLELEIGTTLHECLQQYYLGKANQPAFPPGKETNRLPLKYALTALDMAYTETCVRYETNNEWDDHTLQTFLDEYTEATDLVEEIVRGYHQYARPLDRFTVHAIEGKLTGAGTSWLKKHWEDREFHSEITEYPVTRHDPSYRLLVPIVDPKTRLPLKRGPVLSARIDLLVHRIDDGMKGLWIYDHKSTGSQPNDRGLDFDDQITGYCYSVWRWLGIVPRGVCLNYLIRNAPKEPRILKSGELSTAKNQLTTAPKYRKALRELGLMLKDGTIEDEGYLEAYEALLSRGWNPFFQRHYAARNRQELMSFEERLVDEYEDMYDGYMGDISLYPNLDRRWCPRCAVGPICQAIEDGSDVQGIIETRYEEGPDRKAIPLAY